MAIHLEPYLKKRMPHRNARIFWRICCATLAGIIYLYSTSALAATRNAAFAGNPPEKITPSDAGSSQTEKDIRDSLKKYVGVPYRWGGTGLKGMDCSGLTKFIYADLLGVDLPHSSAAQCRSEFLVDISRSSGRLCAGDLIFFGPGKRQINHVGIYLSDGRFLHASRKLGASIISNLNRPYWKNRVITTRRLKDSRIVNQETANRNPFWRPMYPEAAGWDQESESTIEMEYSGTILKSLNLDLGTFFHVKRGRNQCTWDGLSGRRYRTPAGFNTLQGMHLGTDLAPFDWFRIRPSLTQFYDHGPEHESSGFPSKIISLETLLKAPASRWSLAMAARLGRGEDLDNRSSNSRSRWNTFEVRLGLGFQFSDSLNLSVTGMQDYHQTLEASLNADKWSAFGNHLTFKADIRF